MPNRVNKVKDMEALPVPIEPGTIVTDRVNYYIIAEFSVHGASINSPQYTPVSLTDGHFYCFPTDNLDTLAYELDGMEVLPQGQIVTITHKEYKG